MGNTKLASDIYTARTSIASASNAILTNTANLSSIVEKVEQRFKELEEKEVQVKKAEEEIAKKYKELEEKSKAMDDRELRMAEQEKLWGEIKKVMESSSPTMQVPSLEHSPGGAKPAIRGRERSMSMTAEPPSYLFKRPSEAVLHEHLPPHMKRSEAVVTPDLKRETRTPEPVVIPTSLLTPALDSFGLWLPTRTFSLIYKATRDGFGRADFHKTCDNQGPTVTLILSSQGHLFGGYAPISWGRNDSYDTHPDCFLFTLSNPHSIPPTQYKLRAGNAYGLRNGQHVSFGWCGDIRVADENAHVIPESTSNFPRSFVDTTGKGNATFTGEYKFKVLEIEVYLVM